MFFSTLYTQSLVALQQSMLAFQVFMFCVMMTAIIKGTTDTAVVFEQIMRYQEADDTDHASDLFIQWLQESSKESHEVPAKSCLTIKQLDPHFYIGQQIVICMVKLWSQHRIYFNEWAIRTFYYLSTDAFMKPLLNEGVCHALLAPAIKWGTAQQRNDLMECVIRGKYGAQYAFFNLIRKLRDHKEVSKYFKLWYGQNDAVINDWSRLHHAEHRPMSNYVVFTEYLMRMKLQSVQNNFMYIVNLVDAAKVKVDRYKMNNTLSAEINYFSDATFRALMDIIYEEMRRNYRRSGGNYDHKMYGLIAKRFRGYMIEFGFADKRCAVFRKTRQITEYFYKIEAKDVQRPPIVCKAEGSKKDLRA